LKQKKIGSPIFYKKPHKEKNNILVMVEGEGGKGYFDFMTRFTDI